MQYTIYLDLMMLENLCMDLWLLWMEGRIFRRRIHFGRWFASGMMGAIGGTLLFLWPNMQIITWFLLLLLMQKAAFGNRIKIFSGMCFLLMLSFLAGGFLTFLERISSLSCFFLWFPGVILLGGLGIVFRDRTGEEQKLCQVRLVWHGESLCLTGLFDSGNRLYTPEGHRPVYVADQKSLKCWNDHKIETLLMIPYRSVGRESGLLPAIVIDELWINDEICRKMPVIALSRYPVSSTGQYQILIHSREVSI